MITNRRDFAKWEKRVLGPVLLRHGYAMEGRLWLRRKGAVSAVVECVFEKPRHLDFCRSTIDLGLDHDISNDIVHGSFSNNTLPTAVHCAAHFRIGRVLSDDFIRFLDKWWSLSESEIETSESEVTEALVDKALPFLESNLSLDGIREVAERRHSSLQPVHMLSLAVVNHILGYRERSIEILDRFLQRPTSAWFERAKTVRDALEAVPNQPK